MTDSRDREDDLRRLVAMSAAFAAFLDSGAPYRELAVALPGGGMRRGTLSVGLLLDLLEGLGRDRSLLSPDQRARLDAAAAAVGKQRASRRDAYVGVLLRELRGQLDAWRWYLDECLAEDGECAESYPDEAGKRTRIEQLLDEADRLGACVAPERERLSRLDARLRAAWRSGPYVGPTGAGDRHPAPRHWWLYGRPAPQRGR